MDTKESIDKLRRFKNIKILYGKYALTNEQMSGFRQAIENVLNELDKKDKIINRSIEELEYIRQYFSDECQADFIRILEILKDKNVIDW